MSEGMIFGGWLKQRRKEQGIGPNEFADRLGCSTITLLKIEAGERRPSRQLSLLLAEFFRVPNDEQEAFVTFARTERTTASTPTADAEYSQTLTDRATPWRRAYLH